MTQPNLTDAHVNLKLVMQQHRWANLDVTIGTSTIKIWLSQDCDPFLGLVEWGQCIEDGNLPIHLEIDEEGTVKLLTVLHTEDPACVLLRIADPDPDPDPDSDPDPDPDPDPDSDPGPHPDSNGIFLEGIVSRLTLATLLKEELRRFFTLEFDPDHWEKYEKEFNPSYVSIRDRVLGHSWLANI
ncbi:MAG: hypothetical protein HQL80_00425 [Magnetococcales bacterium]|nr:hypothetical protein [Magnetococcales bacterium]